MTHDTFVAGLESLESRTFFSFTPAQAVAADKLKITADKSQLSADRNHFSQATSSDRKLLTNDLQSALTAAADRVKTDANQEKQAILTDQKNGSATLTIDRAKVTADRKAVAADKGNSSAELSALSKLQSDQSILTADSASLKTTLNKDRASLSALIKSDTASLNTIRKSGDTTTTSDRKHLAADLKSSANAFATDARNLAADGIQLFKDEAAEIGSIFHF